MSLTGNMAFDILSLIYKDDETRLDMARIASIKEEEAWQYIEDQNNKLKTNNKDEKSK